MNDKDQEKSSVEDQGKSISELFEELKEELAFLPEIDAVKEGYLFAYKYFLLC